MPKFNNDKKFDIDLKYGQVREKRIAKILFDKRSQNLNFDPASNTLR